jgi:hypothetical protein
MFSDQINMQEAPPPQHLPRFLMLSLVMARPTRLPLPLAGRTMPPTKAASEHLRRFERNSMPMPSTLIWNGSCSGTVNQPPDWIAQ